MQRKKFFSPQMNKTRTKNTGLIKTAGNLFKEKKSPMMRILNFDFES